MKKLGVILMILFSAQAWSQEVEDFTLTNVLNAQPVSGTVAATNPYTAPSRRTS